MTVSRLNYFSRVRVLADAQLSALPRIIFLTADPLEVVFCL